MRKCRSKLNVLAPAASLSVLATAAIAALLLMRGPAGRAQGVDFEPAPLGKYRTSLYLKATRAPLAELESDVNHLAVLSETCRAEYGTAACGLPDKPLASDKLEERYAYYVRRPVDAHAKGEVKIERRNWASPPASR